MNSKIASFNMHVLCAIVCFLATSSARNLESSFVPSDINMQNNLLSKETLNKNPFLMQNAHANNPGFMKETDQDSQQCLFNELTQELKVKPKSVARSSRTDSEIFSIWALKNSLNSGKKKILPSMYQQEAICSNTNKPSVLENKMSSKRRRFINYPAFQKKKDYENDDELGGGVYNDIEDMRESDSDQDYDNDVEGENERDAEDVRFMGKKDDIDKRIDTFCKDYQREKERNIIKDKTNARPKEPYEQTAKGKDKSKEKDHETDWCNMPYEEKDQAKDKNKGRDYEKDWCKEVYENKAKSKDKSKERDWCKELEKDEENDSDEEKARESCDKYCKNMDRNKNRDRDRERNRERNKSKEKNKDKDRDRCGDRETDRDRNRDRDRDRDICFGRKTIKMTQISNRDNHQFLNFDNTRNGETIQCNNLDLDGKKIIKKRRTSWRNIFRKSGKNKKGNNKHLLGSTEVSNSFDKTLRQIENYKQLASTIIEYASDIEAALVKFDNDFNENCYEEGIDKKEHLSLTHSPDANDDLNL